MSDQQNIRGGECAICGKEMEGFGNVELHHRLHHADLLAGSDAWIVNTKGGPDKPSFEISVLRADNEHGIASYGWFDENKLLVCHNGGPDQTPVTTRMWEGLMELANAVASELNQAEVLREEDS